MTRDTLKIIHAFFPTAVQALVGVFWNTPTVPMWLPMLSTLPTVTLKNKQANKKPNVTLNSPLSLWAYSMPHNQREHQVPAPEHVKGTLAARSQQFLVFLISYHSLKFVREPWRFNFLWVPKPSQLHAFPTSSVIYLFILQALPLLPFLLPLILAPTTLENKCLFLACWKAAAWQGLLLLCPKHVKAMLRAILYLTADTYQHCLVPETEKEGSIPSDTRVLLGQQSNRGLLGSSAH